MSSGFYIVLFPPNHPTPLHRIVQLGHSAPRPSHHLLTSPTELPPALATTPSTLATGPPAYAAVHVSLVEASAEVVLAGAEIRLVGLGGTTSSEFRIEAEAEAWDDGMMG